MVVISFIYSDTQIMSDLVSRHPFKLVLLSFDYVSGSSNTLFFFGRGGLRCSGLLPLSQLWNRLFLLGNLVLFSGEWHLETQIWVLGVLTVTGISLLLGFVSGLSSVYLLICFILSLIPSPSLSSLLFKNFQ